jgi:hypothetical protein
MTAMMIYDGKRVAAGGARLKWHMIPIADIDLIARNTGGKWVASSLGGRWMLNGATGTSDMAGKAARQR